MFQFSVSNFLQELHCNTSVKIEGRDVNIRAWLYKYRGIGGYIVPVFFLDTNIPGNIDQPW